MSQRVGVCIDNMGTMGQTPDEERDEILQDLARLGLEPELVHYSHDPLSIPFEKQIDLLVVDYGIIAIQGHGDDWTRRLLQWADEHPGSVLLIWSSMTADGFVHELRDSLERQLGKQLELDSDAEWAPPWPANVRAYHVGNKWYAKWGDGDGVDWLRSSDEYLRSWFGVTKKTALDEEVEAFGPLKPPRAWDEEDEAVVEAFSDPAGGYVDTSRGSGSVALALAQPRRALIEGLLAEGVEPDAAFELGMARPAEAPPVDPMELGRQRCPSSMGHDFIAEGGTKCRFCPGTRERPPYYGGACSRCAREATPRDAYAGRQCRPCGKDTVFCTCDPIQISHPMLDGRPLLVGDRVRVKGTKPTKGGRTADGVVFEIRFVAAPGGSSAGHGSEVWVQVGEHSEIFQEEDLERWQP